MAAKTCVPRAPALSFERRVTAVGQAYAGPRELRRYLLFYLTYPQIRESLTPGGPGHSTLSNGALLGELIGGGTE